MDKLEKYRKEIDKIDKELLTLLAMRLSIVLKIRKYKNLKKLPVEDKEREKEIIQKLKDRGKENNIPSHVIEDIWEIILNQSKKIEKI